ncbi:MAG TPA: chlorite dismutase family protein [Actinomycetes bacterium]|jgi:peroxiredoxin|nr:chlorite dismutase family protein [Actinomycetes bacterium]
MEPVVPSTGWGVTHLFFRVHPSRSPDPAQAGKELVAALDSFAAAGPDHQVLCASILGLKADLGVMAIGPDLARHESLARSLRAVSPLEPAYSFLSLTEVSEYMETQEDIRARLLEQGAEDLEGRVAKATERLAGQREDRLHPRLPRRAVLAFYPMSKARDPGANWYRLPFERRRELMHGHGKVGRRYTGRVLQLVTGSTGLDDFEWGVTLLADDLSAIKEVVYDMRFDEVTASYGRFGPFLVGLTCDPADLPARLGLSW